MPRLYGSTMSVVGGGRLGLSSPSAAPGDITAPTFVSGDGGGNEWQVNFSEAITSPAAGPGAGVSIRMDGTLCTIVDANIFGGTPARINFETNFSATEETIVTFEYDAGVGDLEDLAGNALTSTGPHGLTNNS